MVEEIAPRSFPGSSCINLKIAYDEGLETTVRREEMAVFAVSERVLFTGLIISRPTAIHKTTNKQLLQSLAL